MVLSAFVKVCLGEIGEALSMFSEVAVLAHRRQDAYLSVVAQQGVGLAHALMGHVTELDAAVEQCRMLTGGRRNLLLESLMAYSAVYKGEILKATDHIAYVIPRFTRRRQFVFQIGLFLHLTVDALFTAVEFDLIKDPVLLSSMLALGRKAVQALDGMAKVFDTLTPLLQLAKARWYFMYAREGAAERAIDLGLHSEEFIQFPYAEGLLLLHSTRLTCLPDEERRARAREG
ncbi:unnamed protein product, partial [Phaeothamnion confervicola]